MAVSFTACGDDDKHSDEPPVGPTAPDQPTNTENDPEGTILMNMICGETTLRISPERPAGWNGDSFSLKIARDMNWSYEGWWCDGIVDCGKVRNISAITSVPESGWGSPAVQEGHGYIARAYMTKVGNGNGRRYSYISIYVTKLITTEGGSIQGATIKYQPDWLLGEPFNL